MGRPGHLDKEAGASFAAAKEVAASFAATKEAALELPIAPASKAPLAILRIRPNPWNLGVAQRGK